MTSRLLICIGAAIAAFSATLALAQPPPTPQESAKEMVRLIRAGNGYARLITKALRWKEPVSDNCRSLKERLEAPGIPIPDVVGDGSTDYILGIQRAEENMLNYLADFSQLIWSALRIDCIALPAPLPPPPPPPGP